MDSALIETALAQPTFCAAFQLTAQAGGDAPALRYDDGATAYTWSQYAERVRALAGGFVDLGLRRGECVGLLLDNRIEFHLADLAAMHLGATPFSIYHTNPPSQIVPLLENSGARIVVTQQSYLDRVRETQRLHPGLEQIVVVDGDGDGAAAITTLDAVAERAPANFDFEATWRAVEPSTVVTLVYTSGTTGAPKGVQHTHSTIIASCASMHAFKPFTPGGRVVTYLPNAHIAERFISHYCSMVFGLTVTCCPDPKKLAQALGVTKPTRLFGVPRIYDRLREAAEGMLAGSARDPATLSAIRAKLGLDAAEWVGVAAAPSAEATLEFFAGIGVHLIEFWGMSECIFSITPPSGESKIGTIGKAAPGVEIRLAGDGEILVRGPNVMIGYRGEEAQTAEALDPDGWLHSGDLAVSDDDGYLTIVDRKKEIIINSSGKNMSPTKIELALVQCSPLIAQAVAIGDRRPFVSALVVLDPEACARTAGELGIDPDLAKLAAHPEIQQRVAAAVAEANESLARVEQIRRHTILGEPFLPGSDVLTPTMKLRRKPINEKYAAQIESLYA